MLTVKTPEEVYALIDERFTPILPAETVSLAATLGRVLAEDVLAEEFVPGFDRSTVDGYAVHGGDTFGSSDALPALLRLTGEVLMGEGAEEPLPEGCCAAVPTGGAVPPGADAVVMQEYTELFGDGTVGISKPAPPGSNLIYRGDDVFPGKPVLPAGRILTPQDIGALAAMGRAQLSVRRRARVGILSTGDELVPVTEAPGPGQIRDVNSALLGALAEKYGAEPRFYGIIRDEEALLGQAVDRALAECDAVLLSGGSSVGLKDAACRVIGARGEILFHGIAMKPGKPTILGKIGETPVFGLPGHPAAAFFVADLFLPALLARLSGHSLRRFTVPAVLTEAVGANHGRAQYNGVFLTPGPGLPNARPIRGKSGLITALAASDGYFCIPRDCEGVPEGATVAVSLCAMV